MCWSLEVSLATSALVLIAAPSLFLRNATPRDRGNAFFLLVFGSMQMLDAALWSLGQREDFLDCSSDNQRLTRLAGLVIMLEPFAALFSRSFVTGKLPSAREFAAYLANLSLSGTHVLLAYLGGQGDCCPFGTHIACTHITPGGHLMYSPRRGSYDELGRFQGKATQHFRCWRQHLFFGDQVEELPLMLRISYLVFMCYPYLGYHPRPSGLVQIAILSITWCVGLSTDAHASMWCLANVAQIATMALDPYFFPPSPVKKPDNQAASLLNCNQGDPTLEATDDCVEGCFNSNALPIQKQVHPIVASSSRAFKALEVNCDSAMAKKNI
jgi:hypothetical protein